MHDPYFPLNIWFQSNYLSEYTGISGIDKFDETNFGNDDDAASLAVSDHRPVCVEFYTDKDDDGVEETDTSGRGQSRNATWGQIRALHEKMADLQGQINSLNKRLDAIEQAIAEITQRGPDIRVEEKATRTQPADDDVTVYITRTGRKYHRGGCSYLKESKIPIKKSEAIRRGYTPCSRCNP